MVDSMLNTPGSSSISESFTPFLPPQIPINCEIELSNSPNSLSNEEQQQQGQIQSLELIKIKQKEDEEEDKKPKKKYSVISQHAREKFIKRVLSKEVTIKEAAKEFGLKFSTSKAILQIYKKEGRIGKKKNRQRKPKVVNAVFIANFHNPLNPYISSSSSSTPITTTTTTTTAITDTSSPTIIPLVSFNQHMDNITKNVISLEQPFTAANQIISEITKNSRIYKPNQILGSIPSPIAVPPFLNQMNYAFSEMFINPDKKNLGLNLANNNAVSMNAMLDNQLLNPNSLINYEALAMQGNLGITKEIEYELKFSIEDLESVINKTKSAMMDGITLESKGLFD